MKERVDILLVERNLFESREKAKAAIMAGIVFANEQRIDKAGEKVDVETYLEIKGNRMPYVSRGGLKLEKAINVFDINLTDRTMLDIGSSTGGFTDCALQNGVKLSYALDVGTNQLAWKLRSDERVVVMEKTNFRYSTLSDFKNGQPDFATIDVSFISLRLILPPLSTILAENGDVIALIKPQFEASRENVGKNGIVRDKKVHAQVVREIVDFANNLNFKLVNLTFSPIRGGEGNIEFLAHFKLNKDLVSIEYNLDKIINEAHNL